MIRAILQRQFWIFFLTISFSSQLSSEVSLPAILSSNMVLQRDAEVKLWGWAESGEEIRINLSWLEQEVTTFANAQGEWETMVRTTNSKDEQTISFNGVSSLVKLENILFGEVWLCSGQSNMELPIKGFSGQPVYGRNEAIMSARNPNLRLFTVERKGAKTPLKKIDKYRAWEEAGPQNIADFSAVAYHYASQLQEVLDVPVGVIHSSWGGSIVEAWMSKEVLSKYKEVNLDSANLDRANREETTLFNAMIHPLVNYTIKGVLWYQGESNRYAPEKYLQLFPAMVKDWRQRWVNDDFPFFYVQIAPFNYEGVNSAYLREAQMKALDSIPNSGMAVALDLGAADFIHPPKKKEVGSRLLYLSLSRVYGFDDIDGSAPLYESYEVQDSGIQVSFSHAENGLYTPGSLTDFEIAGEDRKFYSARAIIVDRKTVFVSSQEVPQPVAVRYGWKNWVQGSLFDASLLPASSFRTDNWNEERID